MPQTSDIAVTLSRSRESDVTETTDVYGPIDFVLIEFQGKNLQGKAAEALLELVDAGIVSIFDILVISKEADGTFAGVEIKDLDADHVGSFSSFVGASSGLLGDDDIAEAAGAMEPGTVAVLIVYENVWARRFVAAAREAGGQMIASARIPAQTVMEVLDAADAAN